VSDDYIKIQSEQDRISGTAVCKRFGKKGRIAELCDLVGALEASLPLCVAVALVGSDDFPDTLLGA